MSVHLTIGHITYSAVLALFLTWLILTISKSFKIVISRPTALDYKPGDINKIIQRCYNLFPKDIIKFQGETFRRGMNVRITTSQHKIFEGRLIGSNHENMVCVLTAKYVVAHDLENIQEIKELAHPSK